MSSHRPHRNSAPAPFGRATAPAALGSPRIRLRSPFQKTPARCRCEKRLLGAIFTLKVIILPRQARDKHRESTRKREAFFAGAAAATDGPERANRSLEALTSAAVGAINASFLPRFYTKKRSFCQDRLGTNIGKFEGKGRARRARWHAAPRKMLCVPPAGAETAFFESCCTE
jgi:hypothetical protein